MNEGQLYEQIGRLTIALAEKEQAVLDCCGVIHGIKEGTINLEQLVTTETSFSLTPASADEVLRE